MGAGRVPIVVRPLDRALTAARLALVPTLVVVLGVPTYRAITSVYPGAQKTWVLTLVAAAAAVLSVVLLQTQPVGQRVDRALARVRRRVAMACNHAHGAIHRDSRIACRLTPEV